MQGIKFEFLLRQIKSSFLELEIRVFFYDFKYAFKIKTKIEILNLKFSLNLISIKVKISWVFSMFKWHLCEIFMMSLQNNQVQLLCCCCCCLTFVCPKLFKVFWDQFENTKHSNFGIWIKYLKIKWPNLKADTLKKLKLETSFSGEFARSDSLKFKCLKFEN